uniref:Ionotropic glutamate receptor C-terminal domain-containing protein n=1 Tax=Daphnia galeata TaxID=27404 RepID=A0A8J2RVN0_9CRUS|nr:unnamed protein product [Daphnia galeata]
MGIETLVLLVIGICCIFQPTLSVGPSPLPMVLMKSAPFNQNHLVFPVSMKINRNATDHMISLEGISPLILEWLSLRYKFNYSLFLPPRQLQNLDYVGPNNPGIISYAVRGECDVIIAVIAPSPSRLSRLDFLHPWLYTLSAFLIPIPELLQNNVDAVVKPFQFWQVFFSDSLYRNWTGGYISNKITAIRLVIGSWCLLTLVLLNVYNGMLFSFVTTTPRASPLVNSVEDVATNPNVFLILNKGLGAESTISGADKGLYKTLGDKMRSYPNSRCNSTKQCVKLVKSLPARHAYYDIEVSLKAAVQEDYRETNECKMTIAARFSGSGYGWGLPKNHRFREQFNQGTLRLYEIGLISLWKNWFEPSTKPCLNDQDASV